MTAGAAFVSGVGRSGVRSGREPLGPLGPRGPTSRGDAALEPGMQVLTRPRSTRLGTGLRNLCDLRLSPLIGGDLRGTVNGTQPTRPGGLGLVSPRLEDI